MFDCTGKKVQKALIVYLFGNLMSPCSSISNDMDALI